MSDVQERPQTETSIVKRVETNPTLVLLDDDKFEELYAEMVREVEAFEPDLSTVTSRKAISSLAYKVTRTKTAIDDAGKKLNEDARAQIAKVDASRRAIRERLDTLRDQARQPLTDWEAAEEARIEKFRGLIDHIHACGNGTMGGEPQAFGVLFHELEEKIIVDSSFGEFEDEARRAKDAALTKLRTAQAEQQQREAERAELERLRAEAAERERQDRERAETERRAAEQREAERREVERAAAAAEQERQRIAAAEERARRQAEEAHAAELRRVQAEHEAQQRKAEVWRREQEEQIARRAAAEAAEVKRIADESAARAADREHRSKVMTAAKEAIMESASLSEAKAKIIVSAIAAGSVPNVTIQF